MEIVNLIGSRLKIIRLNSGIKQKDLAEKLSIKASALSMYEQGKREPSIVFLKSFCDFFNIPMSQFFIFIENKGDNLNKLEDQDNEIRSVLSGLNSLLAHLEKANLQIQPTE